MSVIKKNTGVYCKSLYVLSAVAALSIYSASTNEASATIKSNASKITTSSSTSTSTGISNTSVRGLSGYGSLVKFGKVQHKFGNSAENFKVVEGTDIDPRARYVQFTNTKGELKTYKEGLSTKIKLLWSPEEVGVDSYVGADGKTHKYIYRSQPNWVSGTDIINAQRDSFDGSVQNKANTLGNVLTSEGGAGVEGSISSRRNSASSVASSQISLSESSINSDGVVSSNSGTNSLVRSQSSSSLDSISSTSSVSSTVSTDSNSSTGTVVHRSLANADASNNNDTYRTELKVNMVKSASGNHINFVEDGKEFTQLQNKTYDSADSSTRNVYKISIANKESQAPITSSKETSTDKIEVTSKTTQTSSTSSASTQVDKVDVSSKSTQLSSTSSTSTNVDQKETSSTDVAGDNVSVKTITLSQREEVKSPTRSAVKLSLTDSDESGSGSSSRRGSVDSVSSHESEESNLYTATLVNIDSDSSSQASSRRDSISSNVSDEDENKTYVITTNKGSLSGQSSVDESSTRAVNKIKLTQGTLKSGSSTTIDSGSKKKSVTFSDNKSNISDEELQKVRANLRSVSTNNKESNESDDGSFVPVLNTYIGKRLEVDAQKEVNINANELLKDNFKEDRVKVFASYFETKAEEDAKTKVSNLPGLIDIKVGVDDNKTKVLSTNVNVEETDKDVSKMNIDSSFAKLLSRQLEDGYAERRARAESEFKVTSQPSTTSVTDDNKVSLLSSKIESIVSGGDAEKINKAKEILQKLKSSLIQRA